MSQEPNMHALPHSESSGGQPVSRRRALTVGGLVAGATVATGLLGTGVANAAPLRGLRLTPADLRTDPADAIQAAIDRVSDARGGTVTLPPGTFELAATLHLRSGVVICGAGAGRTTLRDAPTLGAKPLILITGTPKRRVTHVGLRELTIRNGTATTGSYGAATVDTLLSRLGKDGIYSEYATGITLDRIEVTEIQGAYGFMCKATSGVRCTNSRFYRCTYAMFMVCVESENVLVSDCVFDTLTTTAFPIAYAFATSGDTVGQGTFYPRNIVVRRNRISNNPRWLGLNTHGAENISFIDNHVDNVRNGIFVALDNRWGQGPVLRNVIVRGNTFTMSPEVPETAIVSGITVAGSSDLMASNIQVRDNRFVGFDRGHPWDGCITVKNAENVDISANLVEGYSTYGINLVTTVRDARIHANRIRNMTGRYPGTAAVTAGITAAFAGNYGIDVRDNVIDADRSALLPAHALYCDNEFESWQISGNRSGHSDAEFAVTDYLPVGRANAPDDYLTQRRGDVIYRLGGMPGWRVVSPPQGYGSLDTTNVIVYVDIDAGSSTAHVTANGTGDWRCLPVGMNIAITGAGPAGHDLAARVTNATGAVVFRDYSAPPTPTTTVQLDTPARTAVHSAAVRYAPLALRAVRSHT